MWAVVLRRTGEVLARGFLTLEDAETWHEEWSEWTEEPREEDKYGYPAVDFKHE